MLLGHRRTRKVHPCAGTIRADFGREPNDWKPGSSWPSIWRGTRRRPVLPSRRHRMGWISAAPSPSLGAGYSVADVGDVNGTGYDDIAIGCPTLGSTPQTLGLGIDSEVYLVFGSQTASMLTVTDWLGQTNGAYNYTASDRVGDLGQIAYGIPLDPSD